MADNVEKKILLQTDIVGNFVEAKKNVDEVRKKYNELQNQLIEIEKEQGKESEAYKEVNVQIAKQAELLASSNVKYREATKVIQSVARSEELIANTSNNANQSLRALERDLNALRNIDLSKVSKEALPDISKAISETSKNINKARLEIEKLDTGISKSFSRITVTFQAVSASATSLIGILNFAGIDAEIVGKLNQTMVTLISTTQALGVVTEYLSKQKYKLFLQSMKNIAAYVATKAVALGTAAAMLVLGKSVDQTTKKFIILRGVLMGFGIGLLVGGIAALVGAFGSSVSMSNKQIQAYKDMNKAVESTIEQNNKYIQSLKARGELEAKILNESIRLSAQAASQAAANYAPIKEVLDKLGKTSDDLSGKSKKIVQEMEALIKKTGDEFRKYGEDSINFLNGIVGKVQEANNKRGKTDEEYTKFMIEENKKQQLALLGTLRIYKMLGLATQQQLDEFKQAIEENYQNQLTDLNKQTAKKQRDEQLRLQKEAIDKQLELRESELQANATFDKNDFAARLKHALEIFDLREKAEQDKLALDLKYRKIEQTEYDRQNTILENKRKQFNNEQISQVTEHTKQLNKEIATLLQQSTDIQIEETKEQYAQATKALQDEIKKLIDNSRLCKYQFV